MDSLLLLLIIDENDPPFLIIHGDADPLVPHCQSVLLHEALTKEGAKSEMITVPDGGHGDRIWLDENIERMSSFFTEAKNNKTGNQ